MTAAFPGPTNVYLISHDATNNLVVSYSRNPKDFALPEYLQIVPVTKQTGAYLRITPEEAARVVTTDLSHLRWADGHEAPMHNEGGETHEFDTYRTVRYVAGFNLGDLTVQQASWDILSVYGQIYAQQMMTARSVATHVVLSTAGNWPTGHTATASAAGGGRWDNSAVTDLFIKKGLRTASQQILQATLGQVRPKDLVLIVSPLAAAKMSETQEVHSYLKESPFALAQIRGDVPSQNGKFGLPDYLYGYRILIEDAVKVTSPRGASSLTRAYVMNDDEAYLIARVGGIEAHYGGPSFSTVTAFMMEEMTVETKRDDDNRRTKGRIVENYDIVMTAPSSGYRFSDILT